LYQEQAGAVAWTIEGETSHNCITGQGHTPGGESDQSTYCSELFGIWVIMTTLKQITKRNNVMSGQVLVACNGLTALCQAQSQNPVDLNGAHYNLTGAIRTIQDKLPIKIILKHVKGHQDEGCITALTQLATHEHEKR